MQSACFTGLNMADRLISTTMPLSLVFILIVAFMGCRSNESTFDQLVNTDTSLARDAALPGESASASWVNMVWMRSDSTGLPGIMRIFLADGTLVMDSCWETYRLARWRPVSDTVLVWHEDTAPVEAHIEMTAEDEMRMVLVLVNDTLEERYRVGPVPYVCPDMVR